MEWTELVSAMAEQDARKRRKSPDPEVVKLKCPKHGVTLRKVTSKVNSASTILICWMCNRQGMGGG